MRCARVCVQTPLLSSSSFLAFPRSISLPRPSAVRACFRVCGGGLMPEGALATALPFADGRRTNERKSERVSVAIRGGRHRAAPSPFPPLPLPRLGRRSLLPLGRAHLFLATRAPHALSARASAKRDGICALSSSSSSSSSVLFQLRKETLAIRRSFARLVRRGEHFKQLLRKQAGRPSAPSVMKRVRRRARRRRRQEGWSATLEGGGRVSLALICGAVASAVLDRVGEGPDSLAD